ncbi:MAG: ATP-grasp domain-containing protein [Pirellulaceae bacterium]
MQHAGVPTPAFKTMDGSAWNDDGLRYPLIVKPVHESTSYGLEIVHNGKELRSAVSAIVDMYRQPALVEEYIDGREVAIGLLGNEDVEALPTVELDFSGRALKLMTWDDKYHKRLDEPTKICPAPLPEKQNQELQRLAIATFHACHLKDYARVDIRIDLQGNPYVLEINSMASLGDGGSYVKGATTAGYTMSGLVARIVEVAYCRYFGAGLVEQLHVAS